jgi:hypothetical protein
MKEKKQKAVTPSVTKEKKATAGPKGKKANAGPNAGK